MEKIWLRSYPEGVPAEIDIHQFRSLGELFEKSCAQYRERIAYINMDVALTYGDLDRLSRRIGQIQRLSDRFARGGRVGASENSRHELPRSVTRDRQNPASANPLPGA